LHQAQPTGVRQRAFVRHLPAAELSTVYRPDVVGCDARRTGQTWRGRSAIRGGLHQLGRPARPRAVAWLGIARPPWPAVAALSGYRARRTGRTRRSLLEWRDAPDEPWSTRRSRTACAATEAVDVDRSAARAHSFPSGPQPMAVRDRRSTRPRPQTESSAQQCQPVGRTPQWPERRPRPMDREGRMTQRTPIDPDAPHSSTWRSAANGPTRPDSTAARRLLAPQCPARDQPEERAEQLGPTARRPGGAPRRWANGPMQPRYRPVRPHCDHTT